MRRPTTVIGVLPRRFSLALACAGAAGALLVTGLATLPAAAAGSPGDTHPAAPADPSQSAIVILPTGQAPPPSSEAPASTAPASTEPASTAPATHSAAPTSGAAPTSHAVATGTAHATSSAPVATHTSSHPVTSTGTSSGTGGSGSGSGSTGGSNITYYNGPLDLPTDLAASPGAVALVTSKAPGGKPVLVPATSTTISASDRKVGSFSLSSVLITTVVGAAIVALLGALGLWLTHRFGTRLSQADPASPFSG